MNNYALTIPAMLLIGLTLSVPSADVSITDTASCLQSVEYQTTSSNFIADEYANALTIKHTHKSLKREAFDLFGEQSNFSPDERKLYWTVLERDSVNVGVNIFDLFE